jgi:hypothetical protein
MLTPEYLLRVSEGAEEISERLHNDIVSRIVERIVIRMERGEKYILTAQDKWQLEVLQDAGFLLEDIQKLLSERTGEQEKEILEAFEDAGVRNIAYDDKIYRAAGLSPVPLWQSPYLVRLMQRNYEDTLRTWYNFTRTTADASQMAYIQAMDRAYHLVSSGSISYTQAVKEAVNSVAETGVIVRYTNTTTGRVHRDTIETATLRAVRTSISQMCSEITQARMDEMDWDIILTSAHLGARIGDGGENYTNHTWWQGRFFSKSGKDKRFPPFSDCGEGEVQGIHGANCRHSIGPGDGEHNPFSDIDTEENRRIREKEERQRTLERRIRRSKREAMEYKAARDAAKSEELWKEFDGDYQRKSALLQKQNKEYKEFCDANNLKKLDDRLQIAKWDRMQAAEARGAAARYKNNKEKGK